LAKFDNNDRKKLVICGISAGFASVFGTPIAGAIFGVEVLYAGSVLYEVLLPSFIAGVVSYHTTSLFGITYFYYPINVVYVFSNKILIPTILSGIFFGLCGRFFIEIMDRVKKLSKNINLKKEWKSIFAGIILVSMTFIFSTQYLGLGVDIIKDAISGKDVVWYAFILKIIFTAVTLNFGGSGGIVTPIFFVGATAGNFFATIFGFDKPTFAAIGFVSLLAGAANTPISASIMSVELFGSNIAPYASIACVLSFVMTGHKSVYPSQVLAVRKSESVRIETGKEINSVSPTISVKSKKLIFKFLKIIKILQEKVAKKTS
jgi:H+/Cl- antiporter ClcA